jgi:signal transduction histidine kinase/ActR/RegA family two-component response regulator
MNKDNEMEKLKSRIDSLSEELLMAYEELNLYYDISSSMWSPLDSEKTTDLILIKAVEIMEADKGAILVIDESENKLRIRKGLVSGNWISVDPSHEMNIEETILSKAIQAKRGLIVNDMTGCHHGMSPLIATKSLLSVPLYTKDRVIGVLTLGDKRGREFTSNDLKLSAVLSGQAALMIENDRLFQENATMAEIGRIMGSTLNIDEVYERFAEATRNLIPFERININIINNEKQTAIAAYSAGTAAAGRRVGTVFPLAGSAIEEVIRTRSGLLLHPEDQAELAQRFPGLLQSFKAGHRSMMVIPVISKDKVIGNLYFGSTKTKIFTERDLRLAANISAQIAGAIANAQLHAERIQAEKERASLEEQLHQAQKVEAIGTLAGGIAHDFNNILTVILGYAELANLDIAEHSPAKDSLQHSMNAARRAKDLVQQILAFSRQGKQERKPLDMKPIVKEGLKFLRASLPATIKIRQDIEEDVGPIEADPTQIHQVLMNLCTNAAHAMDENGGELGVSLSKLDLDGEASAVHQGIEPGPYVRLRVSDTGHGIRRETLNRIFDPYFTTKEVGKGTGLGLAMVHGIAKSYGGGITVSSEAGKGSTFDVYFPRIEAMDLPSKADKDEPLPMGRHERVLFVDDEVMITRVGRKTLEYLGYEVVTRTSSIEALELFRVQADRFDLVITDMTMPNMRGDKLAQELLKIRPGIPIILCTGFSEHITEEKAKAMGIRGFAMKPLVMKDLARAIRNTLDYDEKKN